jgi:predicted metal-dependent hydrolase
LVISLRRLRKVWFWVKILAAILVLVLILPPVLGWVRHLMYSAATGPPAAEEVVTPAGSNYGQQDGFLVRLVRVLRSYYRGSPLGI